MKINSVKTACVASERESRGYIFVRIHNQGDGKYNNNNNGKLINYQQEAILTFSAQ